MDYQIINLEFILRVYPRIQDKRAMARTIGDGERIITVKTATHIGFGYLSGGTLIIKLINAQNGAYVSRMDTVGAEPLVSHIEMGQQTSEKLFNNGDANAIALYCSPVKK